MVLTTTEQRQGPRHENKKEEKVMNGTLAYSEGERGGTTNDDRGDVLQGHLPLSPATPAESFFLSPELSESSNSVSAFALAAQLQSRRSSRSASATSIATDDFASACENETDIENVPETSTTTTTTTSLFGKDILVLSREPIPEDSLDYEETMSTEQEQQPSYNLSQGVYEKAKGVWSWGKGLPVVGFAERVAEGIASKMVGIAGTSLDEIDGAVKPQLSGLDTSYLNPAIYAVVGVVMKGVSKGDDILRPVVSLMLNTVGIKLLENKKETPAAEQAPEVTTTTTN